MVLSGDLANGSWNNIGQTAEIGTTPVDGVFERVVNHVFIDIPAKFISLEITED